MLKRSCMVLLAFGLLIGSAAAASAEDARNLKIGVVITQKLLATTQIGKNAAEKLKVKKDEAQQQLDRKANEIGDMKKDLEKRLMVLKPEEKDRAREDFDRKSRDGMRLKEDLERELQKEENKQLAEVNEFLSKIVMQYGKDRGYDVILDASATLYFSDAPDVTDEIVAEADKAYKKK